MHQFDEHHSELKGFSKFYEDEIRPYQTEIMGRVWRLGRLALIITGLVLLCVFWGLLFYVFRLPFILSLFGSAGFLGLCFLFYDMNKYPSDVETDYALIRKIAAYVGFYNSAEENPLLLWRSLGLIPYSKSRDVTLFNLIGDYKGTAVKIMHVKVFVCNGSDELVPSARVVAFDGHLIRLDMPKSFSGQTIICRDQGKGQGKTRQSLKRVGLVDPVFEKVFEVYGSDQVESRALLSPDLMQAIVELERVTQGKSIEFGFIAGQLLIKLSKPMQDRREALDSGEFNITMVQNVIDEISSVFDIVDRITR